MHAIYVNALRRYDKFGRLLEHSVLGPVDEFQATTGLKTRLRTAFAIGSADAQGHIQSSPLRL